MHPNNERLTDRLVPLGVSLAIALALCGIAAIPPSAADPIPGQNSGILSNITTYEDSLTPSKTPDSTAQTYRATAHLQIPVDLPQPIMIGHARNIRFDNINSDEVISSTNGLLWMPVPAGNSLSMNVFGTYGVGEHSVQITTTQPITTDTPYAVTATTVFKKSMPDTICGIGLLPPWLCFKFEDPRYSGVVNLTAQGIFVSKDLTSGNGGANMLFGFYDNTWLGPDIYASPTSSDVLRIQDNRGYIAFQKGPLQLDVVSPKAPVPLAENAVNMGIQANVEVPCKITVSTDVSVLDPASNTFMVPSSGTIQELSVAGATLDVGQAPEISSSGGTGAVWKGKWNLSVLEGVSSVALTSTIKYPCPTCLTEARLNVPTGCHKTYMPVISK